MNIKYIVSSMVFWGREHHLSLEQDCEFLKSLGFGIELWPNAGGICSCRFERQNWERLKNATEGMLVTIRSRNDFPSVEQWTEQIECAKLLKAHIVTDLQSFGVPEGVEIDGCDNSHKIMKIAEEHGVKLCLETGNLDKLTKLGEKFDSLLFCLDAGFAHLDKNHSFRQYVDKLAPKVAHLHLTDNYGSIDDHRPPGLLGGILQEDWDYLLETLDKYDNEIIGSLEMCPSTPEVMIHQASEFIFEKLKWPNRPNNLRQLKNLIRKK